MFDIGANLTHKGLRPQFARLLGAAAAAGITDISITAAHPDNTRLALAMIEAAESTVTLSTTAGLHPHLAESFDQRILARIHRYAYSSKVAAIGETGLDYFRMLASKHMQQKSFCAHLALAAKLGKPVFLHQRDAHQDFLGILTEHRPHLSKVVVHCFTDTLEAMQGYLALDCHIGITGWICDPARGAGLRETVRHIPDNRLMIETDAPYLLPPKAIQSEWQTQQTPLQQALSASFGRHNLPHYLPLVLEQIAAARGQSADWLGATTAANARAFFAGTHLAQDSHDTQPV